MSIQSDRILAAEQRVARARQNWKKADDDLYAAVQDSRNYKATVDPRTGIITESGEFTRAGQAKFDRLEKAKSEAFRAMEDAISDLEKERAKSRDGNPASVSDAHHAAIAARLARGG